MTPETFQQYLDVASQRGVQWFELELPEGGKVRVALGGLVPLRRDKGKGDGDGVDEDILYGSSGGAR